MSEAGRHGLWLSLDRAPEAAFDAALEVVAQAQPGASVRLLQSRELSSPAARSTYYTGIDRERSASKAAPGEALSLRQNLTVVAWCWPSPD